MLRKIIVILEIIKNFIAASNAKKTYPTLFICTIICAVLTLLNTLMITTNNPNPPENPSLANNTLIRVLALADTVIKTVIQGTNNNQNYVQSLTSTRDNKVSFPNEPLNVRRVEPKIIDDQEDYSYHIWDIIEQVNYDTGQGDYFVSLFRVSIIGNKNSGALAVVGFPTIGVPPKNASAIDSVGIGGNDKISISTLIGEATQTMPYNVDPASKPYKDLTLFAESLLTKPSTDENTKLNQENNLTSVTALNSFRNVIWGSPCEQVIVTNIASMTLIPNPVTIDTKFSAVVTVQCLIDSSYWFYLDMPVETSGNSNGTTIVAGMSYPRHFNSIDSAS